MIAVASTYSALEELAGGGWGPVTQEVSDAGEAGRVFLTGCGKELGLDAESNGKPSVSQSRRVHGLELLF